ncbi:hypothetical protein Tco_1096667 [Tanacetum coccineum]
MAYSSSSSNANSKMSARDKDGLGYGDQMNKGVLSYENEVFQSVFVNKTSEIEDSLVNDRYAEGMHDVPPPMTGIYILSGPDKEIDESQFMRVPCRWDLTNEYLHGADKEGLLCSISESNALFDMDVAKILRAMRMKVQFSVGEKIALSKQALIAPLAAGGIDSYTRAYPFVVKLHVLQELEDFHLILNGESFLEKSCISEP